MLSIFYLLSFFFLKEGKAKVIQMIAEISKFFSVKGQIINISVFTSHIISVIATQLGCLAQKTQTIHKQNTMCSNKNSFTKRDRWLNVACRSLFANLSQKEKI